MNELMIILYIIYFFLLLFLLVFFLIFKSLECFILGKIFLCVDVWMFNYVNWLRKLSI